MAVEQSDMAQSRRRKIGIEVVPPVRTRSRRHGASVACRLAPQPMRPDARPPRVSTFCYYVDMRGVQHFNFIQRVWLQPRVEMAVTAVMTLALETLAVNLLTEVTRERDFPAPVGITSRCVMQLARRFCEQCLLTSQRCGWKIPRATIQSWLSAQLRARRR
jgi:hypothetical protein